MFWKSATDLEPVWRIRRHVGWTVWCAWPAWTRWLFFSTHRRWRWRSELPSSSVHSTVNGNFKKQDVSIQLLNGSLQLPTTHLILKKIDKFIDRSVALETLFSTSFECEVIQWSVQVQIRPAWTLPKLRSRAFAVERLTWSRWCKKKSSRSHRDLSIDTKLNWIPTDDDGLFPCFKYQQFRCVGKKDANYSRNKEDAERHNEDDYSSKSAEMEMNRLALPNKRNFRRFPLGASGNVRDRDREPLTISAFYSFEMK